MDGWMDGWMGGYRDRRTDRHRRTDGQTDRRTDTLTKWLICRVWLRFLEPELNSRTKTNYRCRACSLSFTIAAGQLANLGNVAQKFAAFRLAIRWRVFARTLLAFSSSRDYSGAIGMQWAALYFSLHVLPT